MKFVIIAKFIFLCCCTQVFSADPMTFSAPQSLWARMEGNTIKGPVVDLLEEMLATMGVAVRPVCLPWARAIAQMESGELDMIPVIFYTEARSRFMAFSIPYIEVPTTLFVPEGRGFLFSDVTDLEGRTGVMMQGDAISDEFHAHEPYLDIHKVSAYEQMVKMLADHRVDYAVAAEYGFMTEVMRLGCEKKIVKLPGPLASRQIHLAISKKSPYVTYLPDINRMMMTYKQNGTISTLIRKTVQGAFARDVD